MLKASIFGKYKKCVITTYVILRNKKLAKVFPIVKDNVPVIGCTISKNIYSGKNDITYFSLAKYTDISAEIYPYHKFIFVLGGCIEVYDKDGFSNLVNTNESIVTLIDTPTGIRTNTNSIYIEIFIRKEDFMNSV